MLFPDAISCHFKSGHAPYRNFIVRKSYQNLVRRTIFSVKSVFVRENRLTNKLPKRFIFGSKSLLFDGFLQVSASKNASFQEPFCQRLSLSNTDLTEKLSVVC